MIPFDEALLQYAEQHTSPQTALLQALERETYQKVLMPQMLSGHLQGATLQFISKILQPTYILEIGTFTGYSALCLAEGLKPNGQLHTIDNNDELSEMQKRYFAQSDFASQIYLHTGNAADIIPTLDYPFDLVFIDADKVNYSLYYDLAIGSLKSGGVIIADNVLWSGKVLLPNPDKKTQAIIAFNQKVHADNRVENILLPVRDGMLLIRKK